MKYIPDFDECRVESRKIIDALLKDGSDPDALYIIEHHVTHYDFDKLEKIAIDIFKANHNTDYDIADAFELEDQNGKTLYSFDVICESKLTEDEIEAQQKELFPVIEKHGGIYDGWGTYFEDPNADEDEYGEDGTFFDDLDDDFDDFDEIEPSKPSRKH